VLSVEDVTRTLCRLSAAAVLPASSPFYALTGDHHFASPADTVTDYNITGDGCGKGSMLDHPNLTIELSLTAQSLDLALMTDRKALCFVKVQCSTSTATHTLYTHYSTSLVLPHTHCTLTTVQH
jgi:hypothetical protein